MPCHFLQTKAAKHPENKCLHIFTCTNPHVRKRTLPNVRKRPFFVLTLCFGILLLRANGTEQDHYWLLLLFHNWGPVEYSSNDRSKSLQVYNPWTADITDTTTTLFAEILCLNLLSLTRAQSIIHDSVCAMLGWLQAQTGHTQEINTSQLIHASLDWSTLRHSTVGTRAMTSPKGTSMACIFRLLTFCALWVRRLMTWLALESTWPRSLRRIAHDKHSQLSLVSQIFVSRMASNTTNMANKPHWTNYQHTLLKVSFPRSDLLQDWGEDARYWDSKLHPCTATCRALETDVNSQARCQFLSQLLDSNCAPWIWTMTPWCTRNLKPWRQDQSKNQIANSLVQYSRSTPEPQNSDSRSPNLAIAPKS